MRGYAAPEIVLGDGAYDYRVDIYSVGCVGYRLLSGQQVFEGASAMAMLVEHASTAPPRLQSRAPQPVPPDLEQVIMDCLEKDPERRPAGAGMLAQRLSACPLENPWTPDRAERWWRAHVPEPAERRPVADVLLSREGSGGAGITLRPLRHRGARVRDEDRVS